MMTKTKRWVGAVVVACAAAGALAGRASAAPTIVNGSFEQDTFTTYPGYISGAGNGPITGWTTSGTGNNASSTSFIGLNSNPTTFSSGQASPFANNGVTPDGKQVAFIQATSTAALAGSTTLGTTVTGLTPGQTYRVAFGFNARNNGASTPSATVAVDGQTLRFQTTPVQAANAFTVPYRDGAVQFTATGTTANLSFTNALPGGAVVDNSLLVDNVRVLAASKWKATPWTSDATSGIDSSRTYTHAVDLGTGAANSVINGVPFTAVAGGNPAVAGSFSTTGWTTANPDGANELVTAGGGSATVADSFVYGGASQAAQTLTLNGLTAGKSYRLTLFGVGWTDAATNGRTATYTDGTDFLTIDEHQFGVDKGIKMEFDYTATGTSETVTLNPTLPTQTTHLYGFANAEVAAPEPGTLGVIGLGAAAVLARRRRRRA